MILRDKRAEVDEKRTVSACLLSLAVNDNANVQLYQFGAADVLALPSSDELVNYFSCIGTSYLLSNNANRWNKRKKEKALSRIAFLIKSTTPLEARKMESENGLLWSSCSPFLKISQAKEPILMQFGAFLYCNFSYSEYCKDLIRQEEIVNKIILLQWVETKGAIRTYTEEFIRNWGEYQCPSLKDICTHTIIHKYPQLHKKFEKILNSM
eukprot:TRINITY_DN10066_c0_g1_i2.p1 TRINITY_DN10066_c0_g1~~TRINITY_DN10066_c0_g1_i2.p1  ORF type:complete len:210 (-),score=17.27 TRINITY_DN10066_c0_g1_i2:79-708(-)